MRVPQLNDVNQSKAYHSNISCDTSNSSLFLENTGKKRSKISLKLSQIESPTMIHEYEELIGEGYEDNETIPKYITDHPIIFPQQILLPTVIQVKMNIFIEIFSYQNAYFVLLNTERDHLLSSLIPLAINQFNNNKYNCEINNVNDNHTELYELELQKNDYNSYSIYSSKKSLRPRLDYPSYELKIPIGITHSDNFSLVFNKDCLLMKKIYKREERLVDERNCIRGCIII